MKNEENSSNKSTIIYFEDENFSFPVLQRLAKYTKECYGYKRPLSEIDKQYLPLIMDDYYLSPFPRKLIMFKLVFCGVFNIMLIPPLYYATRLPAVNKNIKLGVVGGLSIVILSLPIYIQKLWESWDLEKYKKQLFLEYCKHNEDYLDNMKAPYIKATL